MCVDTGQCHDKKYQVVRWQRSIASGFKHSDQIT